LLEWRTYDTSDEGLGLAQAVLTAGNIIIIIIINPIIPQSL